MRLRRTTIFSASGFRAGVNAWIGAEPQRRGAIANRPLDARLLLFGERREVRQARP